MSAKKILLVDDDRDFISAIASILSAQGYETKIANSGIEGYEMAQNFMPDLFILDVNMETKSAGFELNKSLRLNINFKTTPIIMLTGVETMAASNQIVDMYNEMSGMEGFNANKVIKIQNPDGTVAVDYVNDSGQTYFLLLDSFIGKPVDTEVLLKEISRFL